MNVRMTIAATVTMCCVALLGSGSASAADTGAKAAAAAPIRVGVVCTCSGPQGSGQAGLKTFDNAWAKWTNTHGGINGHPVKLYFADDGGDATKSGTLVRRLIAENRIQAIAGYFTTQTASWAADVEKAGIPVIGSPSTAIAEFTQPNFFPTGYNQVSGSYAALAAAKTYGVRKMAVFYCAEAPVCSQLPGLLSAMATLQGAGVTVAASAKVAVSEPSYAAQCLAAKNAGAQSAIIFADPNTASRLLTQCLQQGWKLFDLSLTIGHNEPQRIKGLRLSLTTAQLGIEDTTTPGGRLFHQVIARYAPSLPKSNGYNSTVGMANASLQMFATAAKRAKLTPRSSPSVLVRGLHGVKRETLGGLIAPVTYTAGKPTFGACWFYNTYSATAKTWRANPKPECLSATKKAALQKLASGG